jgi:hypothetical protein
MRISSKNIPEVLESLAYTQLIARYICEQSFRKKKGQGPNPETESEVHGTNNA